MKVRDEQLLPWPRTEEAVKQELTKYYGMISEVDYHIGRILDALEKTGKYDDTIIVFTGDNGLAVGQHGLLGKQNLYDHSIRVPLIMSGPGIPKNTRHDGYCYLNDIFPALCDLAGLPIPSSVESVSLSGAVRNKNFRARDSLFFGYSNIQRGIRKDGWKLIRYNVNGKSHTQLFNTKDDPYEKDNLANDPVFSQKVNELTALLKQEMKKNGDFCDLDKEGWGYPTVLKWNELKNLFK